MIKKETYNTKPDEVILWGCCDFGTDFKKALARADIKVRFFVDLYKHGSIFSGVRTISPDQYQLEFHKHQHIPLIVTAKSVHGEDRFSQVENYIKNYIKLDIDPIHPDLMWPVMGGRFTRQLFNLSCSLRKLSHKAKVIPPRLLFRALSAIVPKEKNRVSVIGRHWGQFLDNGKYFFIYLCDNKDATDVKPAFITERKDVFQLLKHNNLPVYYFPGLHAIWFMLRSSVVVADDRMWIERFKLDMLSRAFKVQLWHGVPLKKLDYIAGVFREYDLLVSTSKYFSKQVYSTVFQAKEIIESGYPRNDILFDGGDGCRQKLSDIGSDIVTLKKIRKKRTEGTKTVLYAPTYRMAGMDANPVLEQLIMTMEKLCLKNNFIFVLKLHPGVHLESSILESDQVFQFESGSDINPLLKETDILITDYSSVYFDFLLLDRPILFFPYDLDLYAEKDLGLEFDYRKMTPGPKCMNTEELEKELIDLLKNNLDSFKSSRNEIRDLAFEHVDGLSSKRILRAISTHHKAWPHGADNPILEVSEA